MTDFEHRAAVRPQPSAFDDVEHSGPDELATLARLDVARALDDLPDAQRSTRRLAFWCGFTYSEIAERTRTPLGTGKSRALLGMHRLEPALAPEPSAV